MALYSTSANRRLWIRRHRLYSRVWLTIETLLTQFDGNNSHLTLPFSLYYDDNNDYELQRGTGNVVGLFKPILYQKSLVRMLSSSWLLTMMMSVRKVSRMHEGSYRQTCSERKIISSVHNGWWDVAGYCGSMAHLPTHACQSPHQNTVKASAYFKRDAAVGLSVEVLLIGPITHYTHTIFLLAVSLRAFSPKKAKSC